MNGALKRDAGKFGLLFASLGGMIGSGWLFGALNAAKIAGPASVISWVIGGIAVLLLAFVYAELTTMFPRPGAVIVFPKLCHGHLAAQIMSWINFLAYVSVAPVEAVAVVSYTNNFAPGLVVPSSGVLTIPGLFAAVALMLVFIVINLLAIKLVLRINNAITWWKVFVPVLTVVALLSVHFRAANFTQFSFAPSGLQGVFGAVSGAGIIFTYLGFRQAIELAGESANPKENLPFAILGSVLLCILLYAGLQIAFIGALSPEDLSAGWAHLHFTGISGPFAGLASLLGLSWLAMILYADAAISPGGTGIIYNTTAARVIYATADEGFLSKRFATVSSSGVPVSSLMLSFVVGLFFLAPLPSWRLLVTYLSSIGVLAYGVGPVVLICFRKTLPEAEFPRPFRLAYAEVFAPLAFMVSNFVVFWAGRNIADHLFGGLGIAFVIYCACQFATRRTLAHLDWRGAWWFAPYFGGLWAITAFGGTGWVPSVLLVAFSLAIIAMARASAMPDPAEAKATYAPKF
jgi:amino acid transporter